MDEFPHTSDFIVVLALCGKHFLFGSSYCNKGTALLSPAWWFASTDNQVVIPEEKSAGKVTGKERRPH